MNVARGGLVEYESVINNLESGHLGGLGTDVAWTEPFNPDDQIFKFKNVIMTPHIAGVTEHSYRSMAKVCGAISHLPFFWSISESIRSHFPNAQIDFLFFWIIYATIEYIKEWEDQ